MYAITQTGWRAIASADDLQAGETASETIPPSVMATSAKNFFSAYYDGTILRCSGGAGYA